MESELAWITEEEEPLIDQVRTLLGPLLENCPEDLSHDLCICRFLRGHEHDPEKAAMFLEKAVEYRLGLIERSPFKEVRAALEGKTSLDLSVLPHAEELSECLPMRVVTGRSLDGLPIICSAVRLADFRQLTEVGDDKRDTFIQAQLEQRWMLLHNLSLEQRRMVKFFDIRDLNGTYVSTLLTEGSSQLIQIKNTLAIAQDFYPEMMHQVAVMNTTSAFSQIYSIISSMLNERMQAKINIFSVGMPFEDIAALMEARAIFSWVQVTSQHLSFQQLTVPSGGNEYLARWLTADQHIEWTATLEDGADVKLHYAFLPEDERRQEELAFIAEETLRAAKPLRSSFTAPVEGVYWFCVDNTFSWINSKTITVNVNC